MAPLVSGGRIHPMDEAWSALAMPSKFAPVAGALVTPRADWSTGSRTAGPRGTRDGGTRSSRRSRALGLAVGGSAGMSRSAGDTSCLSACTTFGVGTIPGGGDEG